MVRVSDVGFEAHALEAGGLAPDANPLEIARDLIAAGKPRTALALLGANHDALADDPEYLLICSEAWWADGDSLRAQQALLGAARLAPEDPAPLLLLGELLKGEGQHEKAERVLDKARSLGASLRERAAEVPEQTDDLIAFAEQQERKSHARLSTTQLLLGALALLTVAGVVAAIAAITGLDAQGSAEVTPASTEAPSEQAQRAPQVTAAVTAPADAESQSPAPAVSEAEPGQEPGPVQEAGPVQESEPVREAESLQAYRTPPEAVLAPRIVASPMQTPARSRPAPSTSRKPKVQASADRSSKPSPRPDANAAPDVATVNQELATLAPKELTDRADALYARGHTAIAAGYYRRALDLDPDYAPALVGIGRSILRAEQYSEAFVNATRALQLARGVDARAGLEAEAIYQLGRVHLHRGELDAARRLFRQSISLSGTPPAAWFYLGEALWIDNSPAAREAYQRYLDLVSTGHLADRARRAIR
jgi:tetratricopeptide (TPR) repeat protein